MISVIVTVGPDPAYLEFLDECLASIRKQAIEGLEIVVVDDAAHLPLIDADTYIQLPWNLGQAAAINIGIAQAKYDLIFVMGGCDDVLLEGCLDQCLEKYRVQNTRWACFSPCLITSLGERSTLPQGVWLFHRSMWAAIGGYPPEAGIGEVDSIFCSLMITRKVKLYDVGKEPLYWHREHPKALTQNKSFMRREASGLIRTMCTLEWKQP